VRLLRQARGRVLLATICLNARPLKVSGTMLTEFRTPSFLQYTFPEIVSHLTDFSRRPWIKVKIRCRTVASTSNNDIYP
jgi:hypothetical protein